MSDKNTPDKIPLRRTLLVVEDDSSLRLALARRLSKENCIVLTAADGVEGLRIAKQKHPDLIVLDIALPRMNGVAMMHMVREEGTWGQNVPVVILTNVSPDHVSAHIRNLPHAAYLIKADLTMDAVIKEVKRHLHSGGT